MSEDKCFVGWFVPVLEPHISLKIMGKNNGIGRSEQSSINLSKFLGQQSEKALGTVSRVHATIVQEEDGRVFLTDNQSRNKTYINHEEVGSEKTELVDNSLIQFGKLEVCFKKF